MEHNIRLTFDTEVSATYIYIQEGVRIAKTVPYVTEFNEQGPMVNLDLAENGSVIGVEILYAPIK